MPSTRRAGVDRALPNARVPAVSSKTATSVKVPPMSTASLRLGRLESGTLTDLRFVPRHQPHRVLAVDRPEIARVESVVRQPLHVICGGTVREIGPEHDL